MKNYLLSFPDSVKEELASISETSGVFIAEKCEQVCNKLSISIENLMVQLLPVAASFSKSPISSFKVGAVVLGEPQKANGIGDLFLGTNLEFEALTLNHSIHAEQSAITNAWLNSQKRLQAIAISAPPCGHCRQFIYEVVGESSFKVILPIETAPDFFSTHDGYASANLSQLLPAAFGPKDFGLPHSYMDTSFRTNQLRLNETNDDELVIKALKSANLSYAPYSENFAGCAMQLNNGKTFAGRYAENAAYNPSLPPLSALLAQLIFSYPEFNNNDIARLVLVEQPTQISQREVTQQLINVSNITLEYYSASSSLA